MRTINMLLRILLVIIVANAQEMELDKRNWIDPTDMLNYDTVNRVMKKPVVESDRPVAEKTGSPKNEPVPNAPCHCHHNVEKCENIKEKLQDCQKKLSLAPPPLETITFREEMPFMKRYVNQLMQHFASDESLLQDYRVTVQLTTENKLILTRFVNGDRNNLAEVDEILSHLIVYTEPLSPQAVMSEWATVINCEFLVVAVILSAVWILLLKASFFKCMLLFTLISTYWHWMHLYQQAVARRQAVLAKLPDLPAECRPDEPQSFFYNLILKSLFGKDADSCEKYHKALGVDPIWEVSPGVAFSDTISQFFTHPFGVLGSNIGTFYYNLNENLPWFSYYILMIATLVFTFFALVAVFKYRIRLPFGIISIEPAPSSPQVQPSTPPPAISMQSPQVRPAIQEIVNRPESVCSGNRRREPIAYPAVCVNCHCQVKLNETAQLESSVISAGAGDTLAVKRECVQNVKSCSTNHDSSTRTTLPRGKEAGDSFYDPDSLQDTTVAPELAELSPNSSKFLSELRSTLQQ